jgi:putative transposase
VKKLETQRVERHQINKSHELFTILDNLSFKSKNLYNLANYYIRQAFIVTSKLKEGKEINQEQEDFLKWVNYQVYEYNRHKKEVLKKKKAKGKNKKEEYKTYDYFHSEHRYLGYDFLEFIMKGTEPYSLLMVQVAQQTLRLLDKNWKSFFESIKDWKVNPSKYKGMPKLPNYKAKSGRFNAVLTNQNCKLKDEYIKFPQLFNGLKLKTGVKEGLQQIRINPCGQLYMLEVVYKVDRTDIKEIDQQSSKRIVSIDLGLSNFATITNNIGLQAVVIKGEGVKTINHYYNKQLAEIKSELKKSNNLDWSNGLDRMTIKRNNQIEDFMHKASRWVINYCSENNIDTIVIGKNEGWKQEVNLGKRNNQNFASIPYNSFISKLEYKCQDVCIKSIVNEESYTSKASFLDDDVIPVHKIDNKNQYTFSGRRIKRGLYQSREGILINADVNGSYNIGRKVFPMQYAKGVMDVALHPVRVNVA